MKTSADLLSVARLMEERSAERYRELAEAFEISCNLDTAEAFRMLAEGEDRHAADFPALVGDAPRTIPWGEDDPEIADPGAVHYLMHPWHAVDLALCHEQETLALFTLVAEKSPHAEVRAEAARLVERETRHVEEMRALRDAQDIPPEDWEDDDDPPNWEAGD
ncbi:rubrerythrin family protein [Paramagnetospirillum kuznetsovii]|uniref:Rubrerythrin family protein n=1 Tax=Paramagnetospirillum kuznetsovii TaxID=2053833 RepID=A0A364NST2_9PROT|nr:ferritin family protein [Paramagnetospirillum kuznetsovii]RAU20143.1 rubrerythrin family protein [Paramagnetospirillum kuznetsovii]